MALLMILSVGLGFLFGFCVSSVLFSESLNKYCVSY